MGSQSRRRKAAEQMRQKAYKKLRKKQIDKASSLVYCKECNFGYTLTETRICPKCGVPYYNKSFEEALATLESQDKEKVELTPKKDRCWWCERNPAEKTYDGRKTNSREKKIKLCTDCARKLNLKEIESDEK
jgi:uncharacterized CHY-type Zn-finger protein